MRNKTDYVYFIQDISTERIKIGVSNNPVYRMQRMQLSEQTVLLLAIKGSYALEELLHKKFKKHRIHGEWFEPAEEILYFINQHDSDIEIWTDI